jgi:hypothetical protein
MSNTNVVFNETPEIDLGSDTTLLAGESIELDAGSGFITYYWSNGSTQQTIVITEMNAGEYIYYVTVSNLYGCENSDSITVEFSPTGIWDISERNMITIYPNPARDHITIKSTEAIHEDYIIRLRDFSGRILLIQQFTMNDLPIQEKLEITQLDSGMYFMEIMSEKLYTKLKLIKK